MTTTMLDADRRTLILMPAGQELVRFSVHPGRPSLWDIDRIVDVATDLDDEGMLVIELHYGAPDSIGNTPQLIKELMPYVGQIVIHYAINDGLTDTVTWPCNPLINSSIQILTQPFFTSPLMMDSVHATSSNAIPAICLRADNETSFEELLTYPPLRQIFETVDTWLPFGRIVLAHKQHDAAGRFHNDRMRAYLPVGSTS